MDKPIQIPVGNACELRIKPILQDGSAVSPAVLSDIEVRLTTANHKSAVYAHTVDTQYICVALPADMSAGEYDVHITAELNDRAVAMHRKSLISRTLFDNGMSLDAYVSDFVIIGSSTSDLDQLRIALANAIAEYNEATADLKEKEEEYAEALEGLTGLAKEATLGTPKSGATYSTIFGAIEANAGSGGGGGGTTDITPITNRLDNTTYGLEAIKDAVDDIDVDVDLTPVTDLLTTEKEGETVSLITLIWNGVNGIFNKVTDYLKVAPTKTEVSAVGGKVDGVDTKIGGINDAASSNTLFGKIYQVIVGLGDYSDEPLDRTLFGQVGFDESNENKSLHEKADDLDELVGKVNDAATKSTIFGKLAKMIGQIGTSINGNSLHTKADNLSASIGSYSDTPADATLFGAIGEDESGEDKSLHAKVDGISQELGKLAIRQYTIPNTTESQQLDSKAVYVFAERTADLSLTYKAAEVGQAAEYHFFIQSSGTPTIDWGDGVTSWNGGSAPTIASGKTYEVSIMNGIGAFFEV